MKKCKIIATVGPACADQQTLQQMFRAGVNVCRLNSSFGTNEDRRKTVSLIRAAAQAENKPIAILQDLQGPKIRIGKLNAPVQVLHATDCAPRCPIGRIPACVVVTIDVPAKIDPVAPSLRIPIFVLYRCRALPVGAIRSMTIDENYRAWATAQRRPA